MRARNLKPGFFRNEELAELPMAARILFQGLWCLADREGRLEDRPKRIKADVLPYDDCDVSELLDGLTEHGFIVRYTIAGTGYIQVVNFLRHQRPHQNESASEIPPMDVPVAPETEGHEADGEALPTMEARTSDQGSKPFALVTSSLNPSSLTPDTGLHDNEPPPPRASEPEILQTAEILTTAPWVGDELPAVEKAVCRAYGLVPEFNPRDGPFLAEQFVGWRGYRKKPPENWYLAWLKWLKKERDDGRDRPGETERTARGGRAARNGHRPIGPAEDYDRFVGLRPQGAH